MRKIITFAAMVLGATLFFGTQAMAEGDFSKQDPITVRLDLGKEGEKEHRFHPDKLTFETGKLYRLVLHNPSDSKHYFTALDFAAKVWTRKVQVMDDLGEGAKQIGEIKGTIREVEVYPGGTSEWWFVPVATGTSGFYCHIKEKDGKTHAETGMKGTVSIF